MHPKFCMGTGIKGIERLWGQRGWGHLSETLAISQQGWKGKAFTRQCPFSKFPRCHKRNGCQQLLDMTSKTLAWGFRWALPTSPFLALLPAWLWKRLQREQLPMWLSSLYPRESPPRVQPRIWPSTVPSFRKHLIPSNRLYPGWFLFPSLTLTDRKSYLAAYLMICQAVYSFNPYTHSRDREGNKVESISKPLVKMKTLRLKRVN